MNAGNRRLSIGIVTPTLSRSGGGIFPIVRAHAKGLHPVANVRVYGLCDEAAKDDVETMKPIEPTCYWPAFPRFGYAPSLSRDLLAADHDIVHQHGLWQYPSIVVNRWRRTHVRPTVISTQGMLEPWAIRNSAARKRIAGFLFERANLEHAACIHCSEAEVAGIRAFGLKNPIAVIPNGIDAEYFDSMPRPPWMHEQKKHLLFLGRIHPKKGLLELLEAWRIVRRQAPQIAESWTVVIAGWDDGGHEARVRASARALELSRDSVTFAGPLFGAEKAAALAHADAFILPSHSEGFPMSVLEAWASGLPVLMTSACNIPEAFEDGAAVEIRLSPDVLPQQIVQALSRADLDDVGRAGLSLIQRRFRWDMLVGELLAVYRWLCGGDSRPACVLTD